MDDAAQSEHHFDIHASIVFQLGQELITDVVQAVIELAKNSYDADASYTNIVVSSDSTNHVPNTLFPEAGGCITIEDNGWGMDEAAIQSGWLTISNSMKREMKKRRATTPGRKRTPLGDKGLGRLGVQKLGHNIELFTKPKSEDFEYHVGWSWRAFEGENTLANIRPSFRKTPSKRRHGTTLVISDLKDPGYWRSDDTFSEFQKKLSQLVSPYGTFQEFTIAATVDGKDIELAEITERIRRLAHLRYKIDFDGAQLAITGRASLRFLRPKSGADAIAAFEHLVESDNGEKLLAFLASQKFAQAIHLKRSKAASWFVEFGQESNFAEMAGLRWIDVRAEDKGTIRIPANPGSFHAEIDAFDLSQRTAAEQGVFDSVAEYRSYIKDLNGVRIFRDGFGVRVDPDWLDLAKQWTGASSYYALKPENTMGFVALTAKDNANLVETTDREGFTSTPHFENFTALFSIFVKVAHDAQEFLRRGWLEFLKANHRKVAEVPSGETPERLHRRLDEGLSHARRLQAPLAKAIEGLRDAERTATAVLDRVATTGQSNAEAKELKQLAGVVSKRLGEAQGALGRLSDFLNDVARLRDVAAVLDDEARTVRSQLDESYEVVSLGLTAEALSHEILNVADHMAKKTQDVTRHVERTALTDNRVLLYIEYVRGSIAALRKQMAHLAPSLKYVRENRETFEVSAVLKEVKEYFALRWEDAPIEFVAKERGGPLALHMNRGKAIQIFDNLILNSEYWVKEELRTGRNETGIITVEVRSPVVRIFDNGPGIDPLVEATLFEPFVSRKPRQKGRGLGLFIVHKLLTSEGCSMAYPPNGTIAGGSSALKSISLER